MIENGAVMGRPLHERRRINFVYNFNASISFDKRFWMPRISRGSIAHVTMLAKQGILTDA